MSGPRRHLLAGIKPATTSLATHPGYPRQSTALAAAGRCGMPNVENDAFFRVSDSRWVPVVRLRKDQVWAREAIEERGVTTALPGEDPR